MTDDEIRNEWADRIASFFCGHNPDQPCATCYAKGQHAYDKLMDGNETAIETFKANIEVDELQHVVARLKAEAKPKIGERIAKITGSIVASSMLVGMSVITIGLLGVLVRFFWGWVFG